MTSVSSGAEKLARDLLSELGRFVELKCLPNDYMCYALSVDEFQKKLNREESSERRHVMYNAVETS